ncbi:uncharacterized protein BYT42DRAFT_570317 [Radiomyces spectabilis]|uniref:uncharacterized protein n=1 Tax=Radiomyces spectabilis TaxID=64574 RepID=UPI0022204769|nr:uncharacterized protein BYT42DRAFT_570317 [Radiomyces spectabilis]KAI8377429.1 hypothetical protein BYT42DRAFT_570317 [Radiomyces spectabilis]
MPMNADTMEAFKQTHLRQNRELVRANAIYTQHIQRLEKEVISLRNENLQLRQELLSLTHRAAPVQPLIPDSPPSPSLSPSPSSPTSPSPSPSPSPSQSVPSNSSSSHLLLTSVTTPQVVIEALDISTDYPSKSALKVDRASEKMDIEFNPVTEQESLPMISSRRRQKHRICYTLPSVKQKLRKGDKFTFGNEE